MRIMGVDVTLRGGDKANVLCVSIVEEVDGKNEVVCINTQEIDSPDVDLAEAIVGAFNGSNCNYLAMDIAGINKFLYYQIAERIDESKLKCKSYDKKDHHALVSNLHKDKVLDKIGIQLKYLMITGGCLRLVSEYYTEFQITTVYSVGVANKVLNEEKIKLR